MFNIRNTWSTLNDSIRLVKFTGVMWQCGCVDLNAVVSSVVMTGVIDSFTRVIDLMTHVIDLLTRGHWHFLSRDSWKPARQQWWRRNMPHPAASRGCHMLGQNCSHSLPATGQWLYDPCQWPGVIAFLGLWLRVNDIRYDIVSLTCPTLVVCECGRSRG